MSKRFHYRGRRISRVSTGQRLGVLRKQIHGIPDVAVVELDRKFSKLSPGKCSDVKLSVPESRIDSIGFLYDNRIRCSVVVHPGEEGARPIFEWEVIDGERISKGSTEKMEEAVEGIGRALGVPEEIIQGAMKG